MIVFFGITKSCYDPLRAEPLRANRDGQVEDVDIGDDGTTDGPHRPRRPLCPRFRHICWLVENVEIGDRGGGGGEVGTRIIPTRIIPT